MKNKILIICIFLILLSTNVNAFGVTAFYWKERPLILNPGQTKDVKLLLQNEQSSDPVTLQAELTTGLNIAELTGKTTFSLDSGQSGVPVNLKITIPETAQIGDEYAVGVAFTTTEKPGKKMLKMGTRISKGIPIVIGKVVVPKKSLRDIIPFESLGGILVVLVLVILALFLIRKRKKK